MNIKLNEISNLTNKYMDGSSEYFMDTIGDSDGYADIIQDIFVDFKHIISQYLSNAIECGFSREIMSIDYGMSTDVIDILMNYENCKLEVDL